MRGHHAGARPRLYGVGMDPVVVAANEQPAARRRTSRRWIIVLAAVAVAAIAWTGAHLLALHTFDDAASAAVVATDQAETAIDSLRRATDDAGRSVEAAHVVGEAAASAEDLVDPNARAALATSADTTTVTIDATEQTLAASPEEPDTGKPVWTWELFAGASRLADETAALEAYTEVLGTAEQDLAASTAGLEESARALYASVPAYAAALEAANVSARAVVLLDLREAADSAASQTTLGSGAEIAFTSYATAADSLKTSQQAELAEKAGPLLAKRLAVEEYARSISGGVVLDFDWAPIVNGIGGSAGMAGTATWNTGRGGFSTITLSNSVAQNWPSADSKALVAHEVGHSITSKCSTLFDSEDRDANEAWATAWAISMGHTSDANGVQAYGYPPESLIATAATCR